MRHADLRLICIALALLGPGLARPAAADGLSASDSVGPAFDISGNVVVQPALEYQIESSVAFDGENYLVVWSDYRSANSYDIFGARVRVDGSMVDLCGFVICSEEGYQEVPVVAFDGTNYLVAWADKRSGTGDIYASRVDPGGAVLDPGGVPVCTEAGGQGEVAIAFSGGQYLLAWTDTRGGNEDIYCARISTDATVLDPGGVPVCVDGAVQRYPAVSQGGPGWLVAWQDRRSVQVDIYAARISAGGAVLDAGGFPVASSTADETYPAVAFNENDWLVVWDEDGGASSRDVRGARVDTSGAVLDPAGIDICDHAAYQGYAVAGTDSSDFMVIWADFRSGFTWDIYGARIDTAGALIDTTSLPICLEPSQQFGMAMGFCGSSYLVTWHDSRNDHKDIFGIRMDEDGVVLDPVAFLVSFSSINQSEPAAAFDGANYLVVRHEWRKLSLYDIVATRVSPAGAVLDPAGIQVCGLSSSAMYPAVSFDGANYLVAWQDYRNGHWDIFAARVAPDGSVLDPSGFSVSGAAGNQERPDVAFNGLRYLVVWQDDRDGDYDISGARVSTAGTVLEPWGVRVSDAQSDQIRPAVASDGSAFLVAWEDGRNVYDDIYAARVSQAGGVLDSAGIAVSSAALAQERADVDFDGERYAVVWQDRRSNVDYDIRMARLETDGTVLDPSGVLVTGASGDQEAPALLFNGRNHVVLWQDRRGSARDIYGARADTGGVVLDPGGFVVSDAEYAQVTPGLASSDIGIVLMVYASYIAQPGYGSYRIWGNFFDLVAAAPVAPPRDASVSLYPNYPNPFRAHTNLRFSLAERAEVELTVYDVEGRMVESLLRGEVEAGTHTLTWRPGADGRNAPAPGVYFLRLKAGPAQDVRKLLIIE